MDQAKSAAWKAVAALAALFLIGTALLLGFARTTPAQENTRAAQAAGVQKGEGAGQSAGSKGTGSQSTGSGSETASGGAASGAAGEGDSTQPPTSQGQVQAEGEDGALAGGTSVTDEEKNAAPTVHPAFDVETGAELYAAACQSCHMPGGTGADGGAGTKNYPALAGNQNLQAAVYPATFILNGAGAMPSFADQLTDEQVAAIINYLRHDLNKFEGDTAASEIAPLRKGARSTELGDDAG
ncbi:cytochrome c class I (plasmid) [Deinococcus proteolyticus MRP]|uniref:Cytochrome c class I n=1 Tax=Deinococcus proteolyticus (strain ATCC 35074 / DSM 20540 / JCM 6276 / NBRC 101906 / NCIMB 13154 / VKM Ac-1939 / CCM 2703 / MRP) TaxID=693977 RepID=F0RPR1_DEIPM|nr:MULTISPECIES: cytochrome c [Deinococcus]ADY27367.1 cytochrome c class I [Deinococcus proteolyticus MRP]MCY1704240.1 cytochrome c [Deinococcus sp. SL84]